MKSIIDKAAILHEALPYIRNFHGHIFVIKYGGHAMVDEALRDSFARDIVLLKYVGINPVIVHGGGPQIDETLRALDIVSERVEGLRVTDERTMRVVEMVLDGEVNSEIVSLISRHGGRAVGLSGRDDGFVRAEKIERMKTRSGKEVDPGRVGSVKSVKTQLIRDLVRAGFIPVIAPIGVDDEGAPLNVNADTVAGKVAEALEAKKLVLMTDISAVRGRGGEEKSSLSFEEAEALIAEGVIEGGMIPKVRCALEAVQGGVRKAHILDGRVLHAVLLEIFTDQGVGTEFTL
ncbi:MAG: acetylglutamate kinase [Sandaracinaceae bacterium]|nr:acetylglutamate kinase [Sandaracinaceae bacterium]